MSKEECNLILVDTDAGIDDAWAILMILAATKENPLLKIVGITCVFGNTDVDNTCINVLRTLDSAKKMDIPVFKGSQSPLISLGNQETKCGGFFGLDGFGMTEHASTPDSKFVLEENAVVALNRIVCENIGKISLLCLGPLTNVALAIRTYPAFAENLKDIFIMGGNYKGVGNATDCAEFNFYADPEAAHIVLNSCIKHKVLVPWETCCDLTFSLDWRDTVLGACCNTAIQLMNHVEKPLRSKPTFVSWMPWDQVVAAVVLVPEAVVEGVEVCLTVELQGGHTRGQGVIKRKVAKNVTLDWRDNVLGQFNNSSIELMNRVERPLRVKPTFRSWMTCDQVVVAVCLAPATMMDSVALHLTVELSGQHTRGQVVVSHKLRHQQNTTVVTKVNQQLLGQFLLKIHNL